MRMAVGAATRSVILTVELGNNLSRGSRYNLCGALDFVIGEYRLSPGFGFRTCFRVPDQPDNKQNSSHDKLRQRLMRGWGRFCL
jgi:hypothetical protein